MRITYAIILATVLGIGLGVGITALRLAMSPWDGNLAEASASSGGVTPIDVLRAPVLAVDQTTYDFGKMDVNSEGRHDFLVTNQGNAELELTEDATGCKCKEVVLEKSKVPPGQSAKVTLVWTAGEATTEFEARALLRTNDPKQPKLIISARGRVIEAVRAVPPTLVFYELSAHESTTQEIPVFCFLDEPMEILGVEYSNPATADFFDVDVADRLTDAQIAEQKDAKSGRMVRVTVKQGLPLGRLRQRILLRTNLPSAKSVTIPVHATVTGDIKVVGRDWNGDTRVVKLGTVESQTGARRTLHLFVRGQHRDEVNFKVAEVFPEDLIRVKLGERKRNSPMSTQTPLLIEIPKGSPSVNHLSSQQGKLGRIVIETGHPETPEVRIYLSFAVKDGGG